MGIAEDLGVEGVGACRVEWLARRFDSTSGGPDEAERAIVSKNAMRLTVRVEWVSVGNKGPFEGNQWLAAGRPKVCPSCISSLGYGGRADPPTLLFGSQIDQPGA